MDFTNLFNQLHHSLYPTLSFTAVLSQWLPHGKQKYPRTVSRKTGAISNECTLSSCRNAAVSEIETNFADVCIKCRDQNALGTLEIQQAPKQSLWRTYIALGLSVSHECRVPELAQAYANSRGPSQGGMHSPVSEPSLGLVNIACDHMNLSMSKHV